MRSIPGFASIVSLLLLSVSANGAVIVNGSFEDPIIQDGTAVFASPTGWSSIGGLIFRPNSNPFFLDGAYWPIPQDGQQYFDVGASSASLTQTLVISQAETFVLTWFDNIAYVNGISPYSVSILDINNTEVASGIYEAFSTDSWLEKQLEATLTPGAYTLVFLTQGVNVPDVLIDNVRAVPEPSALVLVASGAFGLMLVRRCNLRKRLSGSVL